MKIEGLFSSEQLKQYPVVLEPLASVSITYGNIYDEEKKLRLKIMPDFNMVMECFIKTRVPIIKSLQLDICLSLFFNPYFNSFYEYIISKDDCKNIFNKYKRNYLIKRMLNFL